MGQDIHSKKKGGEEKLTSFEIELQKLIDRWVEQGESADYIVRDLENQANKLMISEGGDL